MKAGTTTLYQYLLRHPEIFMTTPKEPQYFSRAHIRARGPGWYQALFEPAGEAQVCGEASTCYSRWPYYDGVPERIKAWNPGVKLIYIMRHPVSRLYSHYKHEMRRHFMHGRPLLDFETFLTQDPEALPASRYFQQIEQYRRVFADNQMLWLCLEDLTETPARTLNRVQRFLDLEPRDLVASAAVHANESGQHIEKRAWRRAVRRIRKHSLVAPIAETLPTQHRRAVGRGLEKLPLRLPFGRRQRRRFEQSLSPLTGEVRQAILTELKDDTSALSDLLGRDLSAWQR